MLHIRLATFDDLLAILAISNDAARRTAANFAVEPEALDSWQRSWRETHEIYPWLVASADASSVINGFAKAGPWKGRCAYNWSAETTIYVDPAHHGLGIGRALYDRLLSTLRAQGYRTLLGGITLPNPASVALHESFGFRRVALLERVGWKFGRWHDVGYWELEFGDPGAPPGAPPGAILPVSAVCESIPGALRIAGETLKSGAPSADVTSATAGEA